MILEKQNERHNTHALSSNSSSSNNHSYDFDIKNKGFRNKSIKDEENTSFNSQTNIRQIAKINSILNKYNLTPYASPINASINKIKEKRESINRKSFFAPKNQKSIITTSEAQSTQRKKKKKKVQINDKNQTNTSLLNANNGNITNNKEKTEEQKKDDIAYNNLMHSETLKSENKNKKKEVIYAISYKNTNKETRFNNIQKYLDDEKKLQKKGNRKSKLLIYQQANNSLNLIRSIEKPQISFITKINKNYYDTSLLGYDMFSGLRLNVKNNFCFFTKKLIRQEEFVQMEKQFKMKKYEQLKKEVEEEKIPTFSSINTSSSDSSTENKKEKIKSKSKPKTKKKSTKHKTKIKPKNLTKKKTNFPKYGNKPIRSISMHTRFSDGKSEEKKTPIRGTRIFQKIPNIKKTNPRNSIHRRVIDLKNNFNKNTKKYSIISRLHEKYFNKKGKNPKNVKNLNNDKIASSSSLRNMKSNFRNNLFNINKNNLRNINNRQLNLEEEKDKMNNSNIKDKDKENNEIDFKKFLEEQKIKKNNQIRNFIKKQGMNSYNFFYPKEPSPLLGVFKNKYSLYPSLNINRRSSLEKEEQFEKKIDKEYNKTQRNKKIFLKSIKNNNDINNNNTTEKNNNENKLHIIEKHHGIEKDCPICRIFKLKKVNESDNPNTINYASRLKKYNKLKNLQKIGTFSPNAQNGNNFNLMKDFSMISRNKINLAKKGEFSSGSINGNKSFKIKKNYNVLFDYFMQ